MQRVPTVLLALTQTQSGQLQNIQIDHRRLGTAERFHSSLPTHSPHLATRITAIATALGLRAVVTFVAGGAAASTLAAVIAFVSGKVALGETAAFQGTVAEVAAGGQDLTANRSAPVAFVATDAGPSEFLVNIDALPGGIEQFFGSRLGWNAGVASFASGRIENPFGCVNTLLQTGKI